MREDADVHVERTAVASRPRVGARSGNRIERVNFKFTEQSGGIGVEGMARDLGVVGDFSNEIRHEVRSPGPVAAVIYLARIKILRERNRSTDVLFRVFRRNTNRPFVRRVVKQSDLRRSLPNEANLIVYIYVLGIKDVVRQRRNTFSVRCEHAPVLTG